MFSFKAVFESVDLDGPRLICESRGLNPTLVIRVRVRFDHGQPSEHRMCCECCLMLSG